MNFKQSPQPFRRASRLYVRAMILYLGIPVVALSLTLVVGHRISVSIADDFSRRLARQYSIEAAAHFQTNMSPHITLMQQVARSTTISRWLADPENEENKALAFYEIMGHAVFSPDTRMMLTTYGALHGYDFSVDLALEEFTSWGRLVGSEVSQWFFDTRDADALFILNIQRDRPGEDGVYYLYVWSNHRAYYLGEFVGVITVGFPFNNIFDTLFGAYNPDLMRGYIIDQYGFVRVDSAEFQALFASGLPVLSAMAEIGGNPLLGERVQSHIRSLAGGVFQPSLHNYDAIPLAGVYRYASIAPIIGTAWSVVVLSNHVAVTGGTYIPMILIAFALIILSVVAGSTMVRRAVIAPLGKLAQSAAEAVNRDVTADLFGTERHDEIGDLARVVQYMRGSLNAVTEYKEQAAVQLEAALKEAQASNRAKSNFLATMSHELRTPINTITGMCAIGISAKDIARKDYAFEKIEVSSGFLLGVVNNVLNMSRAQAGKVVLAGAPFNLEGALQKVLEVNSLRLEEKRLDFKLDIGSDVPKVVIGDEQWLVQIFTHLVSNAIKFSPEDMDICAEVSLASREGESCELRFDVTDCGIGISHEKQEGIFRPFFQTEANTFRDFVGGVGLGLAISKHFVELMGGRIWVTSEPGRGAQFSFTIRVAEGGKDGAKARCEEEDADFSGSRLLLVEDVDINREIVLTLLEPTNIAIECAENGAEALGMFERAPDNYDFIFMDLHMPVMDGYESTRLIRALDTHKAQAIPIVALTANTFPEDVAKCMEVGMNEHLGKPVNFEAMLSVMKRYLPNKMEIGSKVHIGGGGGM